MQCLTVSGQDTGHTRNLGNRPKRTESDNYCMKKNHHQSIQQNCQMMVLCLLLLESRCLGVLFPPGGRALQEHHSYPPAEVLS